MTTRWTEKDIQALAASGKIKGYQAQDKARGGAISPKTGKPSKYGNKKATVNGLVFDSKKEAARYLVLVMMERAGMIQGLELQPEYVLEVEGKKVCKYFPDFRYYEKGKLVVEDVKSPASRLKASYRIKIKMLRAQYGIDILET